MTLLSLIKKGEYRTARAAFFNNILLGAINIMSMAQSNWRSLLSERRAHASYGIAIIATLMAFALRLALAPVLDQYAPLLFFVAPVLAAATVGGLGAGLVSVALSIALALPSSSTSTAAILPVIVFVVVGAAMSARGEWLLRVRRDAAGAIADTKRREAHLQSILDTVPDAMIVIDEQA